MDNYSESERWMKDARDCFERAIRCFDQKDRKGTIQNAQLTIELSAKAIIALFEEPEWTHSPHAQLKRIIKAKKKAFENKFNNSFINALNDISEDVKISAPWHGWSVYGKEKEDKTGWISAVELCNRETAEDLLKRAKRTIFTAEKFLKTLKGKS